GHGTAADPGPADGTPRPWGTMDRSASPDARASSPPPGETVATYAVQYTYTADAERVAIYRPEQREPLAALQREATLSLSGPRGDGPGALLIVVADSAEDALAALDGDPFKRERVIVDRVAREWTVVIGELPDA